MKLVITIFQCKRVVLPHIFCTHVFPKIKELFPGEVKLYLIQHVGSVATGSLASAKLPNSALDTVQEWTKDGKFPNAEIIQHSEDMPHYPSLPNYRIGVETALNEGATYHLWLEDDAIVGWQGFDRIHKMMKGNHVGVFKDRRREHMVNCCWLLTSSRFNRKLLTLMQQPEKWNIKQSIYVDRSSPKSPINIKVWKIEPILGRICHLFKWEKSVLSHCRAERVHNNIQSFNAVKSLVKRLHPESLDLLFIDYKFDEFITKKVFGIGIGKTGTTSLTRAMDSLGYSSGHYISEKDYSDIETKFDFVSDTPIPDRYKELDKRFPGSKFIYTTRDVNNWVDSMQRDKHPTVGHSKYHYEREFYGEKMFDKDNIRQRFLEHERDVLDYFKDRPKDLLILNIEKGDGWGKLCKFLGLSSPPGVPFPHLKKSKNKHVSLITPVMDRTEHLLKSLASWKKNKLGEIIIVDWSSTIPVAETLKEEIKGYNIKVIRVENKSWINVSKARNLGARLAEKEMLLFVDADIIINKLPTLEEGTLYRSDIRRYTHSSNGIMGTWACPAHIYKEANGYNEYMEEEGCIYEDREIYRRLSIAGKHRYVHIPEGCLTHQKHSNKARVELRGSKLLSNPSEGRHKKRSISKPWGKEDVQETFDVTIYDGDHLDGYKATV